MRALRLRVDMVFFLGKFAQFTPRYVCCVPIGGYSFRRIRFIRVYGCEGIGQSSSYVVMGIAVVNVVDMGLPEHI